jgi:hypothetical protein
LGGAPLDDRMINRGPCDWIVAIDKRLGAADPEFPEDPGRELMLAERDQQMLGAGPQNAPGRGCGDRPAQHLLAGWRAPRPELKLPAEAFDLHDRIADRAGVYALAGE